jgi:hypothetical protein
LTKGKEIEMHSDSLEGFIKDVLPSIEKGPVAIVGTEDTVEWATTLRHLTQIGFEDVIVLAPEDLEKPRDINSDFHFVNHRLGVDGTLVHCVNRIQKHLPKGTWVHYCYNAEFLFYPFCETRKVGEMLAFHAEERRSAMITYVVDLYAADLDQFPNAVSLENAHLDRSGYYALGRPGPPHGHPKERQLDFFGGLRWRFEEHVPPERRRIDRVSLFRSRPDVTLLEDMTFDDEEMNTYACPWHHNLTAAVCSFRTAKALKLNPGSRHDITSFKWHNSAPFEWHSRQLLDLGLMETGQWF